MITDAEFQLTKLPSGQPTGTGELSVECQGMSNPEQSKRTQLEEKLRELDQQLRSEMLARGFDPAQTDNLALTAPLARLYMERENLRAEIESLLALKSEGG